MHAQRNCPKLRTVSEARTTCLSTDSPEVVECADVAEQMLQTIQDQKEELRRNGEAIKRLAQAINDAKLMFHEDQIAEMVMLQKEKMKPIPKMKEKCTVKAGEVTVAAASVADPSYRDIIQNQKEEPSWTGEATSEEDWSICDPDPEDDEVIDCDVGDEFEGLCCSPCAEEEWLPSKCCEDDVRKCRPSKQHNDDDDEKYEIDADAKHDATYTVLK